MALVPGSFAPSRAPLARLGLAVLVGLLVASCRYHVGHPAPAVGLAVGAIEAPVVEAGVADALSAGLAAAIRRADAAGERIILVRIEEAAFEPAASREGQVYAWEATLSARFVLTGPEPRELRLRRSSRVATPTGAPDLAQLRGAALEQLARVLAEQAVDSFLYGAQPEPSEGEP
jgi:hypothetical protein